MYRKIALIVAVAVSTATAAHAVIDISWGATSGFYPQGAIDDSRSILDESPTGNALVQLLVNYSAAMPTPSEVLPGGMPLSGDDVVVSSFILTGPGFGDFSAPNYQAPFQSGWVWGRIFSSEEPQVGDFYWNGPVVAIQDIAPLATPQGYNLNLDTAPFQFGGDILDMPVVPEPGSIMLMTLGMVGAYTIRRRRA